MLVVAKAKRMVARRVRGSVDVERLKCILLKERGKRVEVGERGSATVLAVLIDSGCMCVKATCACV